MSPTSVAVIVGALVIAGIGAAIRAFCPAPLTLRAVRARVEPHAVETSLGGSVSTRLGRAFASGPVGGVVERRLGQALRLTGYTVPTVIGTVLVTWVIATLAMMVAVAAMVATGTVSSPMVWLLVPLVGSMFAWRVVTDVRARAARRRAELHRVVNDFVQLLAVALTTNRSVEDALTFAADAGDGFGFDLLRQTIDTAQPMGLTVWDALAAMADTYDLDQLRGLATSLQRQAGVGVSVAGTIRTEAKAMRARQLADITDRADKANANLSLPTMGMVFGMVLFLAFPVMTQISEAFT